MATRIDKWLWAIRVFKTRSMAADACRSNKITVNSTIVKPSRELKIGDIIAVKKMPVIYTYKVLDLINNRQPAKNVPLFALDITPQSELDKLQQRITIFASRDAGTGRPTKRDRREIDDLMGSFYSDLDDDIM